MKIILKPLSTQDLGEVLIEDQLFPVGRGEEPFCSYDASIIAHLSRRHARIFMEGQGAYVADLGSRNGTRLNDKPVEFKPVRLLDGDRLAFANQLEYQVALMAEEDDTMAASSIGLGLTLKPTAGGDDLETVKVLQFPYLISKSDPAFQRGGQNGDSLDYLSRRHAHIFIRNEQLYIEDLASTNGTYLNGDRLDEHARPLQDGDELLFGSDHYAYRVELSSDRAPDPGSAEGMPPAAPDPAAGEHTVMVSSADSFLDIFCVAPEDQAEEPGEDTADDSSLPDSAAAVPVQPGKLGRMVRFGGELRNAMQDTGGRASRARWIVPSILALVACAAAAIYFTGQTQRQMEQLLAQERYVEVIRAAGIRLAQDPADEAMREFSTQAVARYVAHNWLQAADREDYSAARDLLEDGASLSRDNPTGLALLEALAWVTDQRQFMQQRGGEQAPVVIYRDEVVIRDLLARWEAHSEEYRGSLALLLAEAPDFRDAHALAFSQLRALRNDSSVYLGAIEKLDALVRQKLEAGTPQELEQDIDEFARQYARLGGLERLSADLRHYLPAHVALQEGDSLRAATLVRETEFATPPFAEEAQRLESSLLPSSDVAAAYSQASLAWREGELARSLELLRDLSGKQGGELAASSLQAKRKIIADYTDLRNNRGAQDYGERLLAFYNGLDPVEDVYFMQVLAQDYEVQIQAGQQRAASAWALAQENWDRYREAGGIRGLQRLEETVSPLFEQQAVYLATAGEHAAGAVRLHQLLEQPISEEREKLQRDIAAELALQRRSLRELSMVLSPGVLTTKLSMLGPAFEGQPPAGNRPDGRIGS
jgi:pSer/pThr/pTyr-binding forkhead associated (FHA) protein